VKTVVVGGKQGTVQQYTGTVGGQSSAYSTMDQEVKVRHDPSLSIFLLIMYDFEQSVGLKNNSLAPPDL